MRIYGNILFSFYCNDLFFKKGLVELLDDIYNSSDSSNEIIKKMKPKLGDGKSGYHLIDVIVLSSKSIFEKLPTRDRAFDDDGIGAIVFCSVNMEHIIKGLGGYENAIFFTEELSKKEVKEALKSIIFGRDDSRKKMFERIDFDELTDRERLVSMLFKKGKNQRQISNITGINVKTVSSHLRSAMFKYHVNNVSEYRVKLSYIKDII